MRLGRASARRRLAGLLLGLALAPGPAWSHGDLHEQIEAISARIRADPGNAQLVFHRAELYRDHQDWAHAAADYDRVEVLAPGQAAVHLGRGRLWLDMGKFDEARVELDRFLAAEPKHSAAYADRARIAQAQARFGDAAADFARAIEFADAADAELYIGRARALAAVGKRDEAIACLDEGSARLGQPPTLGLLAVQFEQDAGRFQAALDRLDRLRAGAPRQEAWLERRGDVLAAAGRHEEARVDWTDALAALLALPVRLAATPSMQALRKRLELKLAP